MGSGGVRKGGAADVATGKNPPLLRYNPALHCSKSISVKVQFEHWANLGGEADNVGHIVHLYNCTIVHCTLVKSREVQSSGGEWNRGWEAEREREK